MGGGAAAVAPRPAAHLAWPPKPGRHRPATGLDAPCTLARLHREPSGVPESRGCPMLQRAAGCASLVLVGSRLRAAEGGTSAGAQRGLLPVAEVGRAKRCRALALELRAVRVFCAFAKASIEGAGWWNCVLEKS